MVFALLIGEKLNPEGNFSQPIPAQNQPGASDNGTKLGAPGTMTIGLAFMVLFIVFYFITFLVLGLKWPIGSNV
ncbi:MAG: hypothetical protein ACFFE8_12220 [Candidatus Heimdallarchaeota archaeon]